MLELILVLWLVKLNHMHLYDPVANCNTSPLLFNLFLLPYA